MGHSFRKNLLYFSFIYSYLFVFLLQKKHVRCINIHIPSVWVLMTVQHAQFLTCGKGVCLAGPWSTSTFFHQRMQGQGLLPSPNSEFLLHDRPINLETDCYGKEWKLYLESQQLRRWWTRVPENHLIWVIIQASFILKGEGCGWLSQTPWCRNPLFLQLSSRFGHNVPINLWLDNCYFLFYNFLSLYEWKSVIPLR